MGRRRTGGEGVPCGVQHPIYLKASRMQLPTRRVGRQCLGVQHVPVVGVCQPTYSQWEWLEVEVHRSSYTVGAVVGHATPCHATGKEDHHHHQGTPVGCVVLCRPPGTSQHIHSSGCGAPETPDGVPQEGRAPPALSMAVGYPTTMEGGCTLPTMPSRG